jgi:uncharacterized protein (DUF1697 family)
MPVTHVALLRGINVGRAKRVAMADLRALVEGLGYTDARTLLNSGNVVFTARGTAGASAGARIEKALVKELGVPARTIVLTAGELAVAVAANPLLAIADDPSRLLVAFLAEAADRARLQPLVKDKWGREAIALGTRVAYLWCADGILTSPVATAVGRAVGDRVTSRNWTTVLKLHRMASPE